MPVNRKKAATLGASDVGRVTVDGAIERIEHLRSGTVVTLESGEAVTFGPGETVAFPKKSQSAYDDQGAVQGDR